MNSGEPATGVPRYDRDFLLSPAKRNQIVELWEVEKFGCDSFGDPDAVSLYGMRPANWYAKGVRILARTTLEAVRDPLGNFIGADVARVAASAPASERRHATLRQLAWTHDWHVREDCYAAALAQLIEAHRSLPLAQDWDDGTTSSSNGQFYRAANRREALGGMTTADMTGRYCTAASRVLAASPA